MKKLTVAFCFLLSLFSRLSAQEFEGWTSSEKPLLFEKLYLHVDRELYSEGDTIRLKAYHVNGLTHQLNSNLRNLYVQLVAEDGRVVKDIMLFSINGQSTGGFVTTGVPGGTYTIRAFTKYLQSFGEEACFHKKIWITGAFKLAREDEKAQIADSKIVVDFLPESGNMVLNATNTTAFKAIDSKGKGINVSGKIIDDLNNTIVSISTSYLGMGKFMLTPTDGRTYYATIDQHPEMKVELPKAIPEGISLGYKDEGEFLLFTLSSNTKMEYSNPFYFVISHKGTSASKEIEMYEPTQTVSLSKSLFPNGISKISLLDSAMNPFAERLIFVDDNKGDAVTLQVNKTEFKPREEVTIGIDALIEPGDSIKSTLSVAVVNKNYFGSGGNSQNIRSYLLLDSELKGAIESPASYFVDDKSITSAGKLDLLMMVNGWRTYFWDEIEANKTANKEDWNDVGIEIKGFVKKLLWNAPLADASVELDYMYRYIHLGEKTTDQNGRFKFEHVLLADSAKVMLNAKTKDGSQNTEIILDPLAKKDSVAAVDQLRNTCFDIGLNRNYNDVNSFRKQKELEFSPEKGSILLSDVNIIEKRILTDDGHFRIYSMPDNSLTVKEEDYTYNNVFDYLVGKVAGLSIVGDQISIRGGGTPLFLLDGIEVSDFPPGSGNAVREIGNIHMSEIEKIEILKSGVNMATFGSKGGNGVIAIYLKRFDPLETSSDYIKGRITLNVKGFQKAQKFYSPQYTIENRNNPKPDFRPTLFWNPELEPNNGKAKISFFTSDERGEYEVVVEGISKNGKICYGTTGFKVN